MKRILLILVSLLVGTVHADTPPLHQVPLQLAQGLSLPLHNQIQFEIEVSNLDKTLSSFDGWQHVVASKGQHNVLQIRLSSTPQYTGPVTDRYLLNSFVVDFDEPEVNTLVAQFKTEHSEAGWQLVDITRFVSRYIDNPTYVHNFNIASKVAASRSGDCTEFAVLTAALARALGIPARVVLGTVVMEEDDSVNSFGHAWVEAHHQNTWHTLDAALYPSASQTIFYLPSGVLENEGPGFTMSVINSISQMPVKIANLGNVNAG